MAFLAVFNLPHPVTQKLLVHLSLTLENVSIPSIKLNSYQVTLTYQTWIFLLMCLQQLFTLLLHFMRFSKNLD